MDVEGGAEDHVDAVLPRLVPHRAADALDEVHVPGRREQGRDRERRAVVRARVVPLALGLDPKAGGTVRHDDGGNPEAGNRERRPGGAGDALLSSRPRRPLHLRGQAGELHAGAHDEVDLLLPRHRGDDGPGGALAELGEVRAVHLCASHEKTASHDHEAGVPGAITPSPRACPLEEGPALVAVGERYHRRHVRSERRPARARGPGGPARRLIGSPLEKSRTFEEGIVDSDLAVWLDPSPVGPAPGPARGSATSSCSACSA